MTLRIAEGLSLPVDYGQTVMITDVGLAAMGGERPPVDPAETRAFWRSKFTGGAGRMFDILAAAYPHGVTRDSLAEQAGISPTSGTFSTYLSKLRSNDCATVDPDGLVYAHPDLF